MFENLIVMMAKISLDKFKDDWYVNIGHYLEINY